MDQKPTFFFYDLETSGLDPKCHRIMQFAGIRTDIELNPIGEQINIMVALGDDILPDPGAIMVTGITPQQTQEEGYSEADFCRMVQKEVCTPGTIMTGFNSVRFDDEFMRYTFYRNFYDAYEWCWLDGRSRWDLLDVIRLTRAIRPDDIEWPVDSEGRPTNRLELITKANGIDHFKAHDALSDVEALIAVAKLIKQKQPKLFEYMLRLRDKNEVKKLVNLHDPQPFVYASGRYGNEFQKTTLAYPLAEIGRQGSVAVYDLRVDPSPYLDKNPKWLAGVMFADWETRVRDDYVAVPVKELAYNKCPAVSPPGVLDKSTQERLGLDMKLIEKHLRILRTHPGFGDAIAAAYDLRPEFKKVKDCDGQLYDGFVNPKDKTKMAAVRAASRAELADFDPKFDDERLGELLTRYKARNFSAILNATEREVWENYRTERLKKDLPSFMKQLDIAAKAPEATDKQFLLEELQLWAQSIAPLD